MDANTCSFQRPLKEGYFMQNLYPQPNFPSLHPPQCHNPVLSLLGNRAFGHEHQNPVEVRSISLDKL